MSILRVGKKYRLRQDAQSKRGLHPDEIITYLGSEGGGNIKGELMPITHKFKRPDGGIWKWSLSIGELFSGWLEEVSEK